MDIKSLNPKIEYEDNDLLVIVKPHGVIVNNAETVKNQETIQNWAEKKIKTQIEREFGTDFSKKGGIVHRLDKDTSGLLLIAKNQKSFENLQSQFKNRTVNKKYIVLLHGIVEPKKGTINAPIDRLPWNRERFGVFPGGREARSDYEVLNIYSDGKNKYSLVEVSPHTGRTHQIRVHFKYLNHSVVGDKLYGGRKQIQYDIIFCPRQFLHAKSLEIAHPISGNKMKFESQLSDDLQKILSSLTKES